MNKLFGLAIPLMLVLSALGAVPVSSMVQPTANAIDADYTQKILNIANKAETRVMALWVSITSNATLMNNATINGAFQNNTALLTQARDQLQNARNKFTSGEYNDTVNLALNSMEAFRSVYCALVQLLVEPEEKLQGEGLLVAMNCALERLEKMDNALSTLTVNIQDAQNLINQTRILLNTTEATILLQQGNVSEVAHRITEANRLMSQACQMLKIRAQEKIDARIDLYFQKLEQSRARIMERLNATDINATELFTQFGFTNMGEFSQAMNALKQMVKNHMGVEQLGKAIDALNSMANLTERLNLQLQKRLILLPLPPSQPQGEPMLSLNAQTRTIGSTMLLEVAIKNTGNVTIIFPNSAYGATVERKNPNGNWDLYYAPISVQMLVGLKPGENAKINILISENNTQKSSQGLGHMKGINIQPVFLPSGTYRVTVHGWAEGTYQSISVSAEFTVP
ncbi:MAG: hypothetical protein ACUVQ5_04365 [Candidatus Methanomethylicaceae archaeon]